MSLSVGIVGLPNVGKSTLFNALLKKQQAFAANFPFATIEPNIGIVPVPDTRLKKLSNVIKKSEGLETLPPEVPATVEFVDIAGIIAGAHKGEGLGNKFLSHIRGVSVICHVLRDFSDEDVVREGSVDPKNDMETIETELMLADLQTLEKQPDPGGSPDKELQNKWKVVQKLTEALKKQIPARDVEITSVEDRRALKELSLLTAKPTLVVINLGEDRLCDFKKIEEESAKTLGIDNGQIVAISAKIESELAGLNKEDHKQYLKELGVAESGLERLIKKAFSTLGLITFLTAGEKEVRAWTINDGINAQLAAGVIHTDFENKFIKADVVSFKDFTELNGWKNSRDKGKVRSEGREYIVKDGDIIEFRIGS